MAYSASTTIYQLPYLKTGDVITEQQEERRAKIIDNSLYAALMMHSGGAGVINEGRYVSAFASGASSVTLYENKPDPTIEALIGQIYVYVTGTLEWTGLSDSTVHYLYISLIETSSDEAGTINSSRELKELITQSNTTGELPPDSILVGVATTTGAVITLNTSPTGKTYLYTVAEHIADNDDPHGAYLEQTVLQITSGINIVSDARLTSRGQAYFYSGLDVTGESTFRDDVTASKDLTVTEDLSVGDDADIGGDLSVDGSLTAGASISTSGIDVTGAGLFRGDVTIQGDITIQGSGTVQEDQIITDKLSVSGLSVLGNEKTDEVRIPGVLNLQESISSGLDVYDESTFRGKVEIQDELDVVLGDASGVKKVNIYDSNRELQGWIDSNGFASFSGINIQGNIYATGAGSGTVDHGSLLGLGDDDHPQYHKDGDYNISSGLSVFGNTLVTGDLEVQGVTTTLEYLVVTEDLTITDELIVNGPSLFGDDAGGDPTVVRGDLTVHSGADFYDDVRVRDRMYVQDIRLDSGISLDFYNSVDDRIAELDYMGNLKISGTIEEGASL